MLWQLLTLLHTSEIPEGLYKPLVLLGLKLEQETFSVGENSKQRRKGRLSYISPFTVFAGGTFPLTFSPAVPCDLSL